MLCIMYMQCDYDVIEFDMDAIFIISTNVTNQTEVCSKMFFFSSSLVQTAAGAGHLLYSAH